MRNVLIAAGFILASVPAQAMLKVTNMSQQSHTVIYEYAGSSNEHVIAPGRTAYLAGGDGMLLLKGAASSAADDALVGTRNGFFGTTATTRSRIPASSIDEFVIWPDGRLMFQKRRFGGFGGN